MATTHFWIVAGPNGAGKTTSVQLEPISRIIPNIPFLNPDNRTLVKLKALGYAGFRDAPIQVQQRCFIEAAEEVEIELASSLNSGRSVGVETVLSSSKYHKRVDDCVARGVFVGLIYIALSSPLISQTRVAARVAAGGHGVPIEKLAARWTRSLTLLPIFARRATAFWIYDNSNPAGAPFLVASGRFGTLIERGPAFPELNAAIEKIA